MLKSWMPEIIESIKKDLRAEHLKKDVVFHKNYFHSKNPQKITSEELCEGYTQALADSNLSEHLGEYVSNRWLLKNSEIYYFFEKELSAITPNFSDLDLLEEAPAAALADKASSEFGPKRAYIFSVMNSVVFPKKVFEQLEKAAKTETEQQKTAEEDAVKSKSLEDLKVHYETLISRLSDKYEKKLSGLERKYHQDVDMLKKQVSTLQRKLSV